MFDREAIEALQAENAQLRQNVAQLQGLLHQRGEPVLLMVLDALTTLSAMADAGHPVAKDILGKWCAAQQRAQDSAGRLTVVRSSNGGI